MGCGATENFGSEDLASYGQGIAVSTTSHKVYVANTGANNVKVFSRLNLPKFTTPATTRNPPETSVTYSSATSIRTEAGNVLSCEVEYGLTNEYSDSVPCTPGRRSRVLSDISAALPTGTPDRGDDLSLPARRRQLRRRSPGLGRPQPFTTLPAVGGVTTGSASQR